MLGRAGQRDRLVDTDQQQGHAQPRKRRVPGDVDYRGQQCRGRRRDLWLSPRRSDRAFGRRLGPVPQGEPQHRDSTVVDHAQWRRGGLVGRVLSSGTEACSAGVDRRKRQCERGSTLRVNSCLLFRPMDRTVGARTSDLLPPRGGGSRWGGECLDLAVTGGCPATNLLQ